MGFCVGWIVFIKGIKKSFRGFGLKWSESPPQNYLVFALAHRLCCFTDGTRTNLLGVYKLIDKKLMNKFNCKNCGKEFDGDRIY